MRFQVKLLGRADIRDAAGQPLDAVLRSTKRLVLFAYLVLADDGLVRRDRLLALFWPERPSGPARAALRQSLYFIRQHLGDVVRSVGKESLRLDAGALTTDVHAFQSAVGRGDHEAALTAYGGTLLDGVHLDGSSNVQDWLEASRRRLREAAARSSWLLADAAEKDGDLPIASHWNVTAVDLELWDETAVARSLTTLDRIGDHGRLEELYERYVGTLDPDDEPAREIKARVTRARRRKARARGTDADVTTISSMGVAWVAACREARWNEVVSMLTDDCVLLPPQEPLVRGRAAALEWFQARPPVLNLDGAFREIRVEGDVAWTVGWMFIRAEPVPGQIVEVRFKSYSVCHRGNDGTWRLNSMAWNLDTPGPVV